MFCRSAVKNGLVECYAKALGQACGGAICCHIQGVRGAVRTWPLSGGKRQDRGDFTLMASSLWRGRDAVAGCLVFVECQRLWRMETSFTALSSSGESEVLGIGQGDLSMGVGYAVSGSLGFLKVRCVHLDSRASACINDSTSSLRTHIVGRLAAAPPAALCMSVRHGRPLSSMRRGCPKMVGGALVEACGAGARW